MKRQFILTFVVISALFCVTVSSLTHEEMQSRASASTSGQDRLQWPHLVGQLGTAAIETIKTERPDLHVQLVGPGQMTTMDFRLDRVRVYVDDAGNVVRPPRPG